MQQVDTKAQLLAVLDAIQRWLPPAEYEILRREILSLMRHVLPPALETAARLDLEEFNMSPKERFAQEYERDRALYRAEGREEGQRNLLGSQLKLKFGELPSEVLRRLEGAETRELQKWAARILTAATLDAVFEA